MKTFIKENKKLIAILLLIISFYTVHANYLTGKNEELQTKIELLNEPSEVEIKAQRVTQLREEWDTTEYTLNQYRENIKSLTVYKIEELEPQIREAEAHLLNKQYIAK